MGDLRHELRLLQRMLYAAIFHRGIYGPKRTEDIVARFHQLYYDSAVYGGTWKDTRWLGVQVAKCPLDLWIYQEILFETRPDVLVETGSAYGGSALYFASLFDLLGKGRVVSIDIEPNPQRPRHDRISYLTGSSTSDEIVGVVRELLAASAAAAPSHTVMVCLDSDHSKAHVLRELELYSGMVTPGSYLVVEDTNVNGHPVEPDFGEGPMEAVEEFLAEHPEFSVDRSREKLYLTFNPKGFLRRAA
jgi:cephalosporin hydroxylase